MGLFDFLKGDKKQHTAASQDLLQLAEVAPGGLSVPRALLPHWPQIQATALPFAEITATPTEQPEITGSHFGYYPRLPIGYSYPVDAAGNYLYPLAQINLSQVPQLPGYPTSGYLQFYIGADDLMGIDFDDMRSQKNSRVLFFEESEVQAYQEDFSFLHEVMNVEYPIVPKPRTLSFKLKNDYIGLNDIRYQHGPLKIGEWTAEHKEIENELEEFFYDEFSCDGHKVGGYAYFTQYDPREHVAGTENYILLLQVDSDDDICWGDVGVANFFIHPDDLARKDFSKVLYSWDCH